MLKAIKKLFGGSSVDYAALVKQGAKIIDVRTPGEFSSGHLKNAVNIPLDQIAAKAKDLKKDQTYILCCRSGMRSASATQQLKNLGFTQVHNGGSWTSLKHLA